MKNLIKLFFAILMMITLFFSGDLYASTVSIDFGISRTFRYWWQSQTNTIYISDSGVRSVNVSGYINKVSYGPDPYEATIRVYDSNNSQIGYWASGRSGVNSEIHINRDFNTSADIKKISVTYAGMDTEYWGGYYGSRFYNWTASYNLPDSTLTDSDGDGFVDAVETALGSSVADATSKPADIPQVLADEDLKLWLDAKNINGQGNAGLIAGSAISEWKDLSGNGYHLSQSSSARKPILLNDEGTKTIKFNNDSFIHTSLGSFTDLNGSDRTVLVLLKQDVKATNPYAGSAFLTTRGYGHGPEGFTMSIKKDQTFLTFSREQAGQDLLTNQTFSIGDFHILTFKSKGSLQELFSAGEKVHENTLTNWSLSNNKDLTLGQERHLSGSRYEFDGQIAEVLVFNTYLEDSELFKINSYLSQKWGLINFVDSDGDGFLDNIEIEAGSDPADKNSIPMSSTILMGTGL